MTDSGNADHPLYRMIYRDIRNDIESGVLPAGSKLPSIRDCADERGVSVGTIRHVYSLLSRDGLIEQLRGRGTFVASPVEIDAGSRKDKALAAIDRMIEEMSRLSFTTREAQIFFELRLRQMEDITRPVRVAVVAATSEERSIIAQSLDAIRIAGTFRIPFDDILSHPGRLSSGYDFIVAPERLYKELKLLAPEQIPLMPVVLELTRASIAECMSLPKHVRLGILTVSMGFADVMQSACERYLLEPLQIRRARFGDPDATRLFIEQLDVVALAPDYKNLIDTKEMMLIQDFADKGKVFIRTDFTCDRGSMLYINDAIEHYFWDLRESLQP